MIKKLLLTLLITGAGALRAMDSEYALQELMAHAGSQVVTPEIKQRALDFLATTIKSHASQLIPTDVKFDLISSSLTWVNIKWIIAETAKKSPLRALGIAAAGAVAGIVIGETYNKIRAVLTAAAEASSDASTSGQSAGQEYMAPTREISFAKTGKATAQKIKQQMIAKHKAGLIRPKASTPTITPAPTPRKQTAPDTAPTLKEPTPTEEITAPNPEPTKKSVLTRIASAIKSAARSAIQRFKDALSMLKQILGLK